MGNQFTLGIDHKQNIIGMGSLNAKISNNRRFGSGGIAYCIIAIFFCTMFLVIHFDAVIIKENAGGSFERNPVFFNILAVFVLVIFKNEIPKGKSNRSLNAHCFRRLYDLFNLSQSEGEKHRK